MLEGSSFTKIDFLVRNHFSIKYKKIGYLFCRKLRTEEEID